MQPEPEHHPADGVLFTQANRFDHMITVDHDEPLAEMATTECCDDNVVDSVCVRFSAVEALGQFDGDIADVLSDNTISDAIKNFKRLREYLSLKEIFYVISVISTTCCKCWDGDTDWNKDCRCFGPAE